MNKSQRSMNVFSVKLRRAREGRWTRVCVSQFSIEWRLPDSTKGPSAPSGRAQLKSCNAPSSGRKEV